MIVALDCCFIVNLHVDYPCSKAKPNVVKECSLNLARIIVRYCDKASLLAQLVKNLPAMWETWVQSLDWEDPLEKGKATHPSTLAGRIPWTIYSPWCPKESDMTERLFTFSFHCDKRTNPKGFFHFCVYYTCSPSQG